MAASNFAGDKYVMKMTALAKGTGKYIVPIAFEFERPCSPGRKIHIVRYIQATSTNALVVELQPKAPYKPPPRKTLTLPAESVIDGLRPPRL